MSTDIIDLLAGIAPDSPLQEIRALRPQAKENAQLSFQALLEPADPGTFPLAERYAVAAFVARLHGFAEAESFYADLLGDEAPELVEAIASAAADGAGRGPYGVYREPGLASESAPGPAWSPAESLGLSDRLAAALAHTHLLVFRPRESGPDPLRVLVAADWSADDIVKLSQLVAFLTFQLRAAWGLRVLAAHPAQAPASETVEGAQR